DDEVRRLESARHRVHVVERRLDTGDELLVLEELLDLRQALVDDLAHRHEADTGAVLGDREDRGLRVVEDGVGVVLGLPGALRDLVAGVDQRAKRRLLLDDARVVLDVGGSRDAVDERGDVGRAADVVQLARLRERFLESDEIDGFAALAEGDHLPEDAPVRVPEEIVRADELDGEVERFVVDQNRAEDRALGFEVVWKRTLCRRNGLWHGGEDRDTNTVDDCGLSIAGWSFDQQSTPQPTTRNRVSVLFDDGDLQLSGHLWGAPH